MFATALSLVPLVLLAGPPAEDPTAQPTVQWFSGTYEEALAQAGKDGKLVFVDFWVNWSDWCRRFHRETLEDPAVIAALGEFVCLNFDAESEEGKRVADRFALRTYPTLYFVNGAGRAEDVIGGYIDAPGLELELARIVALRDTVSDYEAQLVANPLDHDVRWALANKLWDLDDRVGYADHIQYIEEHDKEGRSAPMRRMAMNSIMEDVYGCRQRTGEFDTAVLEEFLAEEQHARLRWEGWSYLGDTYAQFGHVGEARASYVAAWADVPAAQRSSYAYKVVAYFMQESGTLTPEERRFAVEIADGALAERRENAGDKRLVAPYWALRAELHWEFDERAEAIGALQRAVKADPAQQPWVDLLAKWRETERVAQR